MSAFAPLLGAKRTWSVYEYTASSVSRMKDVDGRDIGERSDAVLRTAMPGHDGAAGAERHPGALASPEQHERWPPPGGVFVWRATDAGALFVTPPGRRGRRPACRFVVVYKESPLEAGASPITHRHPQLASARPLCVNSSPRRHDMALSARPGAP